MYRNICLGDDLTGKTVKINVEPGDVLDIFNRQSISPTTLFDDSVNGCSIELIVNDPFIEVHYITKTNDLPLVTFLLDGTVDYSIGVFTINDKMIVDSMFSNSYSVSPIHLMIYSLISVDVEPLSKVDLAIKFVIEDQYYGDRPINIFVSTNNKEGTYTDNFSKLSADSSYKSNILNFLISQAVYFTYIEFNGYISGTQPYWIFGQSSNNLETLRFKNITGFDIGTERYYLQNVKAMFIDFVNVKFSKILDVDNDIRSSINLGRFIEGCDNVTKISFDNVDFSLVSSLANFIHQNNRLLTIYFKSPMDLTYVREHHSSEGTNINEMFSNCTHLTTIYCNDDLYELFPFDVNVFTENETSLVGAIPFSGSTSIKKANPTNGYFTTYIPTSELNLIYNGNSIDTLYYNMNPVTTILYN